MRLTSTLQLALLTSAFLSGLELEAKSASPTSETPSSKTESSSRSEELLKQRRAQLAQVKPAKVGKALDVISSLENDGFDQFFTMQLRHFRLGFGKVSPLSSFTPGLGYERPRIGSSPISFDVSGAYSVTGYQKYSLKFGNFEQTAPTNLLGGGFLGAPFDFDQRNVEPLGKFLYGQVTYKNYPREEFYGVGPDSLEGDRSNYRVEGALVDLVGGYQPTRWLALEARGGYLPTHIGSGTNDKLANIHDIFDDTTAPGLENSPEFVHFDAGLYLGWLGDPFEPSAQLGFRLAHFNDLDTNRFDFNRFSVDARGYITLGCRQRVVALRGYVSRDFGGSGATEVPFYFMETLGGEETLRGFRNGRFRDENLLYLSSEYRWEANAAIELAVFYDTGKVFPDRSGFTLDHLRHSYGAGIRAKNLRRVVFRMDVGRSEEGTFLYIAFGPSF